jgi:hypothetical protein
MEPCAHRAALFRALLATASWRFFQSSLAAMMCKQLRLSCYEFWELILQNGHNARMSLLPSAPQQGTVCSILYWRVFEAVLRLRRRPASENQFSIVRSGSTEKSIRFSAKRCAYSDMPSFSSQSAISWMVALCRG